MFFRHLIGPEIILPQGEASFISKVYTQFQESSWLLRKPDHFFYSVSWPKDVLR